MSAALCKPCKIWPVLSSIPVASVGLIMIAWTQALSSTAAAAQILCACARLSAICMRLCLWNVAQAQHFNFVLMRSIGCRVMPIMGAGYHSIHHTTYAHNYGHYFVYCDYLFGTLEWPEEFSAQHETKQL